MMAIPRGQVALSVWVIFTLLVTLDPAFPDWRQNVNVRGYLRETPILWRPSTFFGTTDRYRLDNLLHGRLISRLYPYSGITADLELKSRLFNGESAHQLLDFTNAYGFGRPYFNWTHTFTNRERVVWQGTVDRAWLAYTAGPVEVTAGRQRVAWGTCLVWNPTDIFNPSSPLDFDNEEKPGSDAARFIWYLGPNSAIDAAIAPQRESDSTTAAVRLKVNRWKYDWMAIVGRRGPQTVVGASWAGSILGGGFRGEGLLVMPRNIGTYRRYLYYPYIFYDEPQKDYLTAAVSGDYTFRSSLYLHSEILYNSLGVTDKAGGLELYKAFLRGDLSPARLSLFAEVARDITPLVRASLGGILNPYDHSRYIGPTIFWSALTNLDCTLTALLFGGKDATEFGDDGNLIMARLKWSFGVLP